MLDFQKFFKELTIQKVSQIIAALCTVAIVSMDLGVDYTKSEQNIYKSFLFQTVAILSVGHSVTNDLTTTFIIYILWCIFKYTKMSLKVAPVDKSGDTVEEPIESFNGVNLSENEEQEFFFGDEE